MKVENVLAGVVAGVVTALFFGSGMVSPMAQAPKAPGFSGKWGTASAIPFASSGIRPAVPIDAVVLEITVDALNARKASGVVTEFVNPVCGASDAKFPFNGAINLQTLLFTLTRPGVGECPLQAEGSGVQIVWKATLSADGQVLTVTRTPAEDRRVAGDRGVGPAVPDVGARAPGAFLPADGRALGAFGAADGRAPGAFGPAPPGLKPAPQGLTPAPPGLAPAPPGLKPAPPGLEPAPPGLTPAPPGLTPAAPGLKPAVPGLPPAVPGLTPVPPGLGPAPVSPRSGGDRGGGSRRDGVLVMRRLL